MMDILIIDQNNFEESATYGSKHASI